MITLATLGAASSQAVFDQAVQHLLKQGKRSTNQEGQPLYRAPDGSKCPVGCFIADDEYSSLFEYKASGYLPLTGHRVLLDRLQRIHDAYPPEQWRFKLEKTANLFGLKFNP